MGQYTPESARIFIYHQLNLRIQAAFSTLSEDQVKELKLAMTHELLKNPRELELIDMVETMEGMGLSPYNDDALRIQTIGNQVRKILAEEQIDINAALALPQDEES